MAGEAREREVRVGCDMGYQCIRVTTRSRGLSLSGPLICHTVYAHTHTKAHAAHDDNIERETCVTIFPFFYFDVTRLYAISVRIIFHSHAKLTFLFKLTYSFFFQITKFIGTTRRHVNRFI